VPALAVLAVAFGALAPTSWLASVLRAGASAPTGDLSAGVTPAEILGGVFCLKLALVGAGVYALLLAWLAPGISRQASPEINRWSAGRGEKSLLAAILVAATAVRLYGLGTGLWLDEILTYVSYARMSFGQIVTTYDSQNQHFLFSLLAHIAFLLFGDSSWSLRLPSVLFGVLSIWALYLLIREVGNAREALLGAALLAFSYHHVWFSQNARGYTGLLFWAILSSWLLVRAMRARTLPLWALYGLTAALGVYTHMTMLFVVAGQLVAFALHQVRVGPTRWAAWLTGLFVGFGIAGYATLLLHSPVIPQFFNGHAVGEVSTVPAWKNPLWTLVELVNRLELSLAGGFVAAAALVVFVAGLLSFARREPAIPVLLIVPALLCGGVVVAMGHHLWPRFFFFAFGFAVAVVIRGVSVWSDVLASLARRWRIPATGIATVGGGALVLLSSLSVPFAYRPKQDFEGALAFIEANEQPGDSVLTAGLAVVPYRALYRRDWPAVETVDGLEAVRAQARRTMTLSRYATRTAPTPLTRFQPSWRGSPRRTWRSARASARTSTSRSFAGLPSGCWAGSPATSRGSRSRT
jgi:hypothetical protein